VRRKACGQPNISQVVPQTLEEWIPYLAFGRFGAVLDLSEQLGFKPDALVRDPLRVWLRLAYRRLQAFLQVGRGYLVEAMVDLPA
jgi:hypothetical protein